MMIVAMAMAALAHSEGVAFATQPTDENSPDRTTGESLTNLDKLRTQQRKQDMMVILNPSPLDGDPDY